MATTGSSSPTNISKNLKGIHFPASRKDLVERARKNGANEEVLRAIREMPDQSYSNMADVMKGFGRKHS